MNGLLTIHDKRFRPLISEERISATVKALAEKINQELKDEKPLFLSVLNGSFMFSSDLLKNISIPCELSFIRVKSYAGTESTGQVKEIVGLEADVRGRTVVILEDIVDTGVTLEALTAQLKEKEVKKIKVATCLFKPGSFKMGSKPDYVCFEVEDQFVVGYGMDYDGHGRNLKEIYVLA